MTLTISANATIIVVTQQGNSFSPSTFNASVGDTVRWVWTSGSHTTTSTQVPGGASSWDSELSSTVQQFDYVITVAGTYNYVCVPHQSLGMVGSFTATGSLGLNNKTAKNNTVQIYPNPAKETAELRLTSDKSSRGTLTIYDLLGNQVSNSAVVVKNGQNNIAIPIDKLLPGVYFVELKYNDHAIVVRRLVRSK